MKKEERSSIMEDMVWYFDGQVCDLQQNNELLKEKFSKVIKSKNFSKIHEKLESAYKKINAALEDLSNAKTEIFGPELKKSH